MASVKQLQLAIRTLVSERQALHELGAGPDELEENRGWCVSSGAWRKR